MRKKRVIVNMGVQALMNKTGPVVKSGDFQFITIRRLTRSLLSDYSHRVVPR